MKKVWPIIYAIGIPLAIFGGYRELDVEATTVADADWLFIGITFVLLAIFPIGAVAYGFWYSKKDFLRRPTWDRHPIGWWTDTLQPLRVSLVLTALYALGAAAALPRTGKQGVTIFFFYFAGAVGLFSASDWCT